MDPAQQWHLINDPTLSEVIPIMPNKEITVNLIAKTAIEPLALRDWLSNLGVSAFTIDKILSWNNTSGEILTACAAKQCYMSFEAGMNPNVTKTRNEMVAYLENVMNQGHGSVLEHVSFTFAIDNVTRVFTGEMNRHRVGTAISERSMRYIRFNEEMNWWMPLCFRSDETDDLDITARKATSRRIFEQAFIQMQDNYKLLCDAWTMDESHHNFHYKKTMTSAFRRIIGMGVCTGGIWTINVRALRHILTMRCSKAAEEEIQLVAHMILEIMRKQEPVLFEDFNNAGTPLYNKI